MYCDQVIEIISFARSHMADNEIFYARGRFSSGEETYEVF